MRAQRCSAVQMATQALCHQRVAGMNAGSSPAISRPQAALHRRRRRSRLNQRRKSCHQQCAWRGSCTQELHCDRHLVGCHHALPQAVGEPRVVVAFALGAVLLLTGGAAPELAQSATGGPVNSATYVPGPVNVGWQIYVGAAVATFPFVLGAYEFGKRILIQRRCAFTQAFFRRAFACSVGCGSASLTACNGIQDCS
jgi:hypothetical protein